MIVLNDKIKIGDKDDLYRIILKVKTIEFGIHLSDSHINLIIGFYNGGINEDTYHTHVLSSETNKNYFKSKATIDNAKTYLKKNGVILKEGIISPSFLPVLEDEDILLTINVLYQNDK